MKSTAAALRRLQPLPGVVLAAALSVAGYVVRYVYVEPERFGIACEKDGPWWCLPRTALIIFTQWNGFGQLALFLAAVAGGVWLRGRNPVPLAMMALGVGGAGLFLYNTTLSSLAVVVAVLVLASPRR